MSQVCQARCSEERLHMYLPRISSKEVCLIQFCTRWDSAAHWQHFPVYFSLSHLVLFLHLCLSFFHSVIRPVLSQTCPLLTPYLQRFTHLSYIACVSIELSFIIPSKREIFPLSIPRAYHLPKCSVGGICTGVSVRLAFLSNYKAHSWRIALDLIHLWLLHGI